MLEWSIWYRISSKWVPVHLFACMHARFSHSISVSVCSLNVCVYDSRRVYIYIPCNDSTPTTLANVRGKTYRIKCLGKKNPSKLSCCGSRVVYRTIKLNLQRSHSHTHTHHDINECTIYAHVTYKALAKDWYSWTVSVQFPGGKPNTTPCGEN